MELLKANTRVKPNSNIECPANDLPSLISSIIIPHASGKPTEPREEITMAILAMIKITGYLSV